ncbi:sphingolipid resistance protein [Scheffersomyces xylosifermentans]|uniref:sphingolipid resistance protein n=1 Tax=Scheffersomyces xylosifermentans TaxID=1304137 RepID=UPI00315C5AF1
MPADSSDTSTITKRSASGKTPVQSVPSTDPTLSPQQSNHLSDAGNQSNDHYKSRLSPFRYKLRSLLLPIIRSETKVLHKLQTSLRHPLLDYYFAWTANLASHTFYVLMLPPPIWFGASKLSRDLVYVLGLGIYFSGALKDYFCLPRPRSPPLHRITMSSYTTQEYGFPSSHSANATAVSLILLSKLIEIKSALSTSKLYVLLFALFVYYVSLIFGRLYCGMHGVLDIAIGSLIGVACFSFRYFYGTQWDLMLFDNFLNDWITPVLIIGFYLLLIHIHSEPIDDCPCFDDSVSFIGVLLGLDLSHYVAFKSKYFVNRNAFQDPLLINFEYSELGWVKTALRFVLGVTLVVIWKAVSKPIIFTILPPIYKFIGVSLPRRNFIPTAETEKSTRQIRSTSISNDQSKIGDFNNLIKGFTDHSKRDEIGPETEIDYYAILDYNQDKRKRKKSNAAENAEVAAQLESFLQKGNVFKPRYDVETIGRTMVYAGVSTTTVWGFSVFSELFNLN